MQTVQPKPSDAAPDHPRQPGVIPEVYAKHLAELQFLWEQRQRSVRPSIPCVTWPNWMPGSWPISTGFLWPRGAKGPP